MKLQTKDLSNLRKAYEDAVVGYINAFVEQFDIDIRDTWWVGDRIGIDNFCFGDMYAISLDDIIYCVEHGVTYDEFVEHTDYWMRCDENNLPKMNLKSWHEGAPRVPQEVFDRLNALRKNISDLIEEQIKDGAYSNS